MAQESIPDFIIQTAISTGFTIFATWILIKKLNVLDCLDPTSAQKKRAKLLAEEILSKIGVKDVELNEYELTIAAHIVMTQNVEVGWDDIGGYEEQISLLQDTVIVPLKFKIESTIFSPAQGVLIYGPPGCGKTLMAKAVAKAADARFIHLNISNLTDKWYGESNKLASAVFSLAKKLQPAIIFIDEIDAFLRTRQSHDHEATSQLKSLFLSLWDGFDSDPKCRIVIMGATNRPQDIDPAVLRRMPARVHIQPPNRSQRKQILDVILNKEKLGEDVDTEELARLTESFVGSDLKEIGRLASVVRVKDLLVNDVLELNFYQENEQSRLLCQQDFLAAIEKCKQFKRLNAMSSPFG